MASPAGKQFEVSSVELSRHNGFRWSLDQPFDVFVGHAVGDGLRFEARAGLVPHSDAWADLLTIDTTSDATNDATNDATSDAALFGAEASLAVVAEFGPRRVSPWRLALGGGWGEADRAFVRAMDQSFTAGTSGTSDGEPSDGEAVIWLRLSRDF